MKIFCENFVIGCVYEFTIENIKKYEEICEFMWQGKELEWEKLDKS